MLSSLLPITNIPLHKIRVQVAYSLLLLGLHFTGAAEKAIFGHVVVFQMESYFLGIALLADPYCMILPQDAVTTQGAVLVSSGLQMIHNALVVEFVLAGQCQVY